ncbi:MAG: hypothetical protein J6R04_06890 [Clostridia bacterium]|nr:hypothetical protein [Clostridia bacterium]
MKLKTSLIAILLTVAILLTACARVPSDPSNETPEGTPSDDAPTPPSADPFEAVRESDEAWLAYGLSAYESKKEPQDLTAFFSDAANMTYLTLYDHMFEYDEQTSIPIAEALFAFICDNYGAKALLDMEKRCEYKTAYLRSLGLDMTYGQLPEIEAFLAGMNFSSDDTHQYQMTIGSVTYYFKDFSVGSPSQYHGFLYHNTTGLLQLIEYMRENGLDAGLDVDREIHYYMTFDGSPYSQTRPNGDIYVNDSTSALHEAVHAMGVSKNDNIWLSEGICNYLGRSLGFNAQIAASYIQMLKMAELGYLDGNAAFKEVYGKVYEIYTEQGGAIDQAATFDLRLYHDAMARVELELGEYVTLGDAYQTINRKECDAVGGELSYEQATSLICYLVDVYGVDTVFEAYHTQDVAGTFGKDYSSLKTEWLAYLHS